MAMLNCVRCCEISRRHLRRFICVSSHLCPFQSAGFPVGISCGEWVIASFRLHRVSRVFVGLWLGVLGIIVAPLSASITQVVVDSRQNLYGAGFASPVLYDGL